jgi:hypothetical protein
MRIPRVHFRGWRQDNIHIYAQANKKYGVAFATFAYAVRSKPNLHNKIITVFKASSIEFRNLIVGERSVSKCKQTQEASQIFGGLENCGKISENLAKR